MPYCALPKNGAMTMTMTMMFLFSYVTQYKGIEENQGFTNSKNTMNK